ncbi:MAG: DUF1631 family protein, partial [Xenophilus sp.]
MSTTPPTESAQKIARQTRERFVGAMDAAILAAAQAVRERLVSLAGGVATAREMQEHRDNLVAYRGAESGWVALARAQWRKALGAEAAAPAGANPQSLRLELVGDEVVENNILSSRLALALQDKANFELNDLRLRIQHLEGRHDLDSRDVLKPEFLAKLLVEQWLAAGMSRQLWTQVQGMLHVQLGEAALRAYKDANAFLVEHGVMPEIDLKGLVRRPGSGGGSGSAPLGPARGVPPGTAGFAPAAIGVRPPGASGPLAVPP